ncbi:hypothetical protein TTHERM_00557750 (macronuclear) [Tetrahymena thermophila SB210]|uniref:Uncharacterized protein n=1 Tax=Tetrahymena thermophila (strain SB210) TaxID=312017 RepID=I7LWL1_TETTS|nr:hypothetical protein TTHERM_00557750 [Tetrahymena thermophila SB210]EAS02094.2 hypothetical protein TTHERM_00557750 [Tetrahymena thermophila SB210]|eukprot:XP_001022339.2 hypothetical protein TTHERM_00557750 [Tetrahymena thermophila SB210]
MNESQQDQKKQNAQHDQVEKNDCKVNTNLCDNQNTYTPETDKGSQDLNSQSCLSQKEEDQKASQENIKEALQFEEIKQNDDQPISIYKIQKCFYNINQQKNLLDLLKKKAGIEISEFEIFFQNLETILNCNAQNINYISKLGQKLAKEYVQTFNASNINKLIQVYMSDPKNIAQDEVQIKSEFIRFSNENQFQQMIEEDTDYESDSSKIFDQFKDLILNNQFQDIQQVQDLSQNCKQQMITAYSRSKISEMISVYQKIQFILQGNRHPENIQKPILQNQNQQCQSSNEQLQIQEIPQENDKSERNIKSISTNSNKELNNQQNLQQTLLVQQASVLEINIKNQNILDDNKANSQDQISDQMNEAKQNDEETQKGNSYQFQEEEKILKILQQKFKIGLYVPKNIDHYNNFINELAQVLLKKLPQKSINECIDKHILDCHVNNVMALVNEITEEQKNSDNDNLIINSIKQQIPLFRQSLNDEEIQQLVQQMKMEGLQSSLFQKYIENGNEIIEKKIFDIHQQYPFLNEKTSKFCQQQFGQIKFQVSEIESQIILDQYYFKIQQHQEQIKNNIERFKLIEEEISRNTSIRKYLEQIYSLSLKKKLQTLFNLSETKFNEKFIIKKLINQDDSQDQLQRLVEKYNLDKNHEDFQILEQIFQSNELNINSLYYKSVLLVDINKPKDNQELYFSKIYKFLLDIQSQGLKALLDNQYQLIIKLLKIDESILNANNLENLDQYYIQLLQFSCSQIEKKIELIQFILRKQLSNFQIDEDQLNYISKQIDRTGLTFIYQLNEQSIKFVKDIDQNLSKCQILKKIYGRNLYELQDQTMTFYFDFENQLQIQNKRDELFKIGKCIDLNQLLEYHNSQQKITQIEAWIKDITDLYINSDSLFSSRLYDLIIYLSKRNQNLDIVFQKIQECLMKNQVKQNRFLINKKTVFEYLMEYSDSQAQLKLILLLGFANPVPLLRTKLLKMEDNSYKFQQQLIFQSFWLLKKQDQVVASLGIGFQKGKSQFLNETFATNFAISDGSYSFISSADIQSNHIFQQNKRKYFVADFHGDASLLDEQYILGFFVYYILQVNISLIKNNKLNELERVIQILEKNNKKYCLLIRDTDENSQLCDSQITNCNLKNETLAWLKKKKLITLPNLKLINDEKKKYHINQTRIMLDNLVNTESENESSLNLFIERFFSQNSQQNQIQKSSQINNEWMYEELQKVNVICDELQQIDDISASKLFYFYSIFSKYQKTLMECSDRKFKNSTDLEIKQRRQKFEKYEHKYKTLKVKDDKSRSYGANLFEKIICDSKNLYHNMLLFIQKLKEVNNQRVGLLKEEKRNLIYSKEKEDIQKMQKLDQQILDNQISVELFWREIIQLWYKHTSYSKNSQLIEAYATMIYNGFPFEIIDGETFYYPFEFLYQCFQHSYFTNKKFCIISIIGPQNSGKSTLLNYFLGCDFYVSDGRCTRGIYGTLVKSKIPEFDYILVIDSEGLLSQEKDDPDYDRMLTLFCLSVSQFLIINVKDQLTPEMTKILELCVDVSRELKANQIPKRVVEIVFNQKADPNNENNKVAINKALKSFEQNSKLSDHIEISHENATNLPTAFSYKYIDLEQQQNNWNYLETQITFVEGVQNLGDKIIQKLIQLSQQEQQKTFKLVKTIPELLKLMKDIYETINQNSDLTAYKDILHKENDQKKDKSKKMLKLSLKMMYRKKFQLQTIITQIIRY